MKTIKAVVVVIIMLVAMTSLNSCGMMAPVEGQRPAYHPENHYNPGYINIAKPAGYYNSRIQRH